MAMDRALLTGHNNRATQLFLRGHWFAFDRPGEYEVIQGLQ